MIGGDTLNNMIFASRVRELRDEKGMTQESLAAVFDYTKQAVQQWENGGKIPRNEVLIKLAEYFNVTTDYLLGKTDVKQEPAAKMQALLERLTPQREAALERVLRLYADPNGADAVADVDALLAAGYDQERIELYIKMSELLHAKRKPPE